MYSFADRDIMMRFRGGGVGHKFTCVAKNFFKSDRDPLDIRLKHLETTVQDDAENVGALEEIENPVTSDDEDGCQSEEGWGEDEDSEFDIESEEGAEEPEEDDFGPEGEGTGQNHDMEELGYDEL